MGKTTVGKIALSCWLLLICALAAKACVCADNPPYLHSGEWTLPAVDLAINGRGFDYVFARKYESQALYDGPLGQGWDHNYFARLLELPSGDVFYFDGMGRKELFKLCVDAGDDTNAQCKDEDGKFKEGYISPSGNFVLLSKLEDGYWLIVEADGLNRLFNNYGQLARIRTQCRCQKVSLREVSRDFDEQ